MRKAGGKWRAVVEVELGTALRKLQTRLEGIYLPPERDDLLLLLRKVERRGD
jgi:hypothetical protein